MAHAWNGCSQRRKTILVPRGRAPFGQHQESRPLARSNDILVLNGFVNNRLKPEPIRLVRLDSEHAQSDGKSVNRGLPLLDLARGRDSWCWPKGARPLGTRMTRDQSSRFLPQARRIVGSWEENDNGEQWCENRNYAHAHFRILSGKRTGH